MKRNYTWLAVSLIAAIAVFAGYKTYLFQQNQVAVQFVGEQIPEFSLKNLSGELVSSTLWAGKVRLINFWASWCPPCRREIPGFAEVHDFYQDQGFEVIGIAVDRQADVEEFLEQMSGIQYTQLIGDDDAIELGRALGNPSGGLPYSVLVDRQGMIRFVKRGELEKILLIEKLEPLL